MLVVDLGSRRERKGRHVPAVKTGESLSPVSPADESWAGVEDTGLDVLELDHSELVCRCRPRWSAVRSFFLDLCVLCNPFARVLSSSALKQV